MSVTIFSQKGFTRMDPSGDFIQSFTNILVIKIWRERCSTRVFPLRGSKPNSRHEPREPRGWNEKSDISRRAIGRELGILFNTSFHFMVHSVHNTQVSVMYRVL